MRCACLSWIHPVDKYICWKRYEVSVRYGEKASEISHDISHAMSAISDLLLYIC